MIVRVQARADICYRHTPHRGLLQRSAYQRQTWQGLFASKQTEKSNMQP